MNNTGENLFEFMGVLQKLKDYKRWENTETFIKKESIADHIWKVMVINYTVHKNLKIDLDLLKIIKLALIHDLAEALTEDIDYNLVYKGIVTPEEKYKKEYDAINKIKEVLGGETGKEIYNLWLEYEKWESGEVKFVKALEKIEPIDHCIFYGYSTIDIPEKFAKYCDKSMSKVPELKGFYHLYKTKLKQVFDEGNFEWRECYNTKGPFEEFKDFEMIFQFFQTAQKLKETKRYETIKKDEIKDTVSDHSFRLTFFVWIIVENLDLKINLQRALEIAIFHDIVESIAGDTDYSLIYTGVVSKEEKNKKEILAMKKIREILPKKIGNQIYELWDEYEKSETREAKIVKALDKLETIDHFIRHGLAYIDNRDRVVIYLNSSIKLCSEIEPIFNIYKEKLKEMYKNGGFEWKKEYNL
ncbi:MAG: HD domain-containing protein [Candidatus Gracilibacteria bacterium]